MKKKRMLELEPVRPVSNRWIGSCYDQEICAVMPYFGIDENHFLLTKYEYFKPHLGFEPLVADSNEELYRKLGLEVRETGFLKPSEVVDLLNDGCPVLAGSDCFWIKRRTDSYKRLHMNHFVLVYGYDLRKKVFKVVEHEYVNSFTFLKMQQKFRDFMRASRSFREHFGIEGSSGKYLRRTGEEPQSDFFVRLFIDRSDRLAESRQAIADNLDTIVAETARGFDQLMLCADTFRIFLTRAIVSRNILLCAAELFPIPDLRERVEKLLIDYSFVQSLIGKIVFRSERDTFRDKYDVLSTRLACIRSGEDDLHTRLIEMEAYA